ncbi:AraC family transcriptional regulator [Pseudalkalibacillus sp. Hm43]|uniref:AraC family transcriptional regulator n=1 Tax=Pseudalkalibacillus sp. Hm43 TaxID=3450742 RepID=UPI003F4398AD
MHYEERKPPKELQPYVKCFWTLNRTYDENDSAEVLWPDGCYEMIFHFGSAYQVKGQELPVAFLIGSLTKYHVLEAEGQIKLFGIRLKPWGLKRFVNEHLKGLKDRFVPLEDLLNSGEIARLTHQLEEIPFDDAFNALSQFMIDEIEHYPMDNQLLAQVSRIYDNPIETDLSEVIEKSHYSKRQFERKCSDLTGLTPKKLSKVARFNQVRLRIFFNPTVHLHDCMHEFGYFDYAHFSKEFKESLGITPKEYQQWIFNQFNQPRDDVAFLQEEE